MNISLVYCCRCYSFRTLGFLCSATFIFAIVHLFCFEISKHVLHPIFIGSKVRNGVFFSFSQLNGLYILSISFSSSFCAASRSRRAFHFI